MESQWTVVVVAKGMWPVTEKFLDSLLATIDEPIDLVYVDNGAPYEERLLATNGWNEWHKRNKGNQLLVQSRVFMHQSFTALPECWNFAIEAGVLNSYRVLICNNDIVFNQVGWMKEFRDGLNEEGVGAVGLIGMSWKDTSFLQGCLFGFTRDMFSRVGDFDEQMMFTCEDVDWCKRMFDLGFHIKSYEHLRDEKIIEHGEGTTRNYYKEDIKEMQRLAHISRINWCYKHCYPDISIHD